MYALLGRYGATTGATPVRCARLFSGNRFSALGATLSPQPLALTALGFAHRDPALLALGHKPALPFGIAQDPVPSDPFPKPLQQTLC